MFTPFTCEENVVTKKINIGRQSTDPEAEAIVFMLGMRMNRLRSIGQIARTGMAMGRMLTELFRSGDLGLLSARTFVSGRDVMVVQYWRSAEELQAYARASDHQHLPAWKAFNKAVRDSADVGIWHETYRVSPGMYEAIYVNMPSFGLAGATGGPQIIGAGRHSAAARLDGVADEPALDPTAV